MSANKNQGNREGVECCPRRSGNVMPDRIAWLDVAKGAAIIGVAFHHVIYYLLSLEIRFGPFWDLDEILRNIRMPLFFFCAGITASFAAHRPPFAFWRKRLIPLIWILIVWTGLYVLADKVLPMSRVGDALEFSLIRPQLSLWFVWVLIVFTAAVPIAVRLNGLIVIGTCGCLAVLWHTGYARYEGSYFAAQNIEAILNFAPLFAFGLFLARHVIVVFNDMKKTVAVFCVSTIVFTTVLALEKILPSIAIVFDLTASVVGVAVGASISVIASRSAGLRRLFSRIGEHSLSVFLGHQLFIPMAAILIAYLGMQGSSGGLLTAFVTLVVVLFSVLLRRAALMARMGFLYAPPSMLTVGVRKIGT